MILNSIQRIFFVAQSLNSIIVKIKMSYFNIVFIKTVHIHTKAVILRCDSDCICDEIFDRMVGAAMAEF